MKRMNLIPEVSAKSGLGRTGEAVSFRDKRPSVTKRAYQITFAVLVCFLVAATAQAKGYVIAEGGNCVTVTFNYNEQGQFIGNTTSSGACATMPDGVYPFALVVNPQTQNPTPLDASTTRVLGTRDSLYKISLQILEVIREADKNRSALEKPTIRLSREYARVIEEGLRHGTKIKVSVRRGYLSSAMEEVLKS